MFRYSLRTLLVIVTLTALSFPWLLFAIRRPVIARVDLDGIRMPPERMPDEPENTDRSSRPRIAFRDWFNERQFAYDATISTRETDCYRGVFGTSKPLVAKVRFSHDTRAYISVEQQSAHFPWENSRHATMDAPGIRFTQEVQAWGERYHQMEQGIRRLAGVEESSWGYPEDMVFSPGVRYSPPGPGPRSDAIPQWSRGFDR